MNILREERLHAASGGNRPQLTSHIVIPSHFKSGVTLYIRADSASYAELEGTAPEFPSVEQLNGKANESRKQTLKLQKKKLKQNKLQYDDEGGDSNLLNCKTNRRIQER